MSGFAQLEPALTAHVHIDPGLSIGSLSSGPALSAFNNPGGSLKSESGFSPAIDAELVMGNDFVRLDTTQKHFRLDARTVMKNNDGSLLTMTYKGIIRLTPELGAVFQGSPDAKTTDFGDTFIHVTFETGAEHLRDLENGVFVAAGRFILEQGKPTKVEYKISRLVSSS
ncbi:MAG: hypothetical protein M1833_006132 [Piccolia ochrophora]|nr:MAG: hypothetical protein M1833_006132 [Piccolia ochrophora]